MKGDEMQSVNTYDRKTKGIKRIKEIKKKKEDEEGKKKQHALLDIKDYLDLKYEFRRNELTLEIEVRPLDTAHFVLLDEAFINSIWIDLQIDGYKCSDATLLKILNV